MPTRKKPWRTIIVGGGSGRFTPEQIQAAVRAVREKNERKAARQAKKQSAEGKMPTKKKAWPTIIQAGDTGRFTWEQIDAAITKVIARREARMARASRAANRAVNKVPTGAIQGADARSRKRRAKEAA